MKKDWMIVESELDADQIRILTATLDRSCIVEGCAGSGKSILALIKAQRIQKERGNNYRVIVFTKALCRYMNTGRVALGLTRDFEYYYRWSKSKHPADYIIVDEIQDFSKEEIEEFIDATNKHFFFFGDTAQSLYDGIPQKDIPNLFKRFSQGTAVKRSTGTGLGLYLSRQIIEAHEGKIWVDSKVDKGSEFSFLLTNVVINSKIEERQVSNG